MPSEATSRRAARWVEAARRRRGRASGWGWRSALEPAPARGWRLRRPAPMRRLRPCRATLSCAPLSGRCEATLPASNCWARASSRISAKWCPAVRAVSGIRTGSGSAGAAALLEDLTADGREVRKTITVVFCDLAGSTALGERLDPESPQRVLGRYYQRMREVLAPRGDGGEVYRRCCGGVFGIPHLHTTPCGRRGLHSSCGRPWPSSTRSWNETGGHAADPRRGEHREGPGRKPRGG